MHRNCHCSNYFQMACKFTLRCDSDTVTTVFKSEHVINVTRCMLYMYVVNAVPITYSVALNRLAYQSSVYRAGHRYYNASLANDGNLYTNMNRGNAAMCSVSRSETNPWWAVDLGKPTAVHRVDLTNSETYCTYV